MSAPTVTIVPEVRDQWLAALRSGTYRQGRRHLALYVGDDGSDDDDPDPEIRYCCLGVLCDLAKDAGFVRSEGVAPEIVFISSNNDEDCSSVVMPEVVARWAFWNFDGGNPLVRLTCEQANAIFFPGQTPRSWPASFEVSLASLNDAGATFDEIAQVIELDQFIQPGYETRMEPVLYGKGLAWITDREGVTR